MKIFTELRLHVVTVFLHTFTSFSIRMQLVPNSARALVRTQGIETHLSTPVLHLGALVELLHERRRETALLHGSIGHELDQQVIAGGLYVRGDFVPAEHPEQFAASRQTVPDLDVVVDAVVVVFHLEGLKLQRHLVVLGHG